MPSAFAMVAPGSVEEALADLERLGPNACLYAGGVELAMLLSTGVLQAEYLIDVKRVPGLNRLEWDDGAVRIGATATHAEVAADPGVRERLPLLANAESRLGNIRVRALGTIGGNLSLRYSHSDLLPPLLVHEATVVMATGAGTEELPVAAFLERADGVVPAGPDELRGTSERVGMRELIVAVRVPALSAGWRSAHVRAERLFRPPDLNAAIAVRGNAERIEAARIAVGCSAPHARRLAGLEQELPGMSLEEARRYLRRAEPDLVAALELQTDLLGSVEYKAHLAATLLARGLGDAVGGGT